MQVLELSSRYAIKILHTPGHTMESVVYLLIDRQNSDKPLQVRAMQEMGVAEARRWEPCKVSPVHVIGIAAAIKTYM